MILRSERGAMLQYSKLINETKLLHSFSYCRIKRPQKKFNALDERNPALFELQKLLGLEVDF